MNEELAKIHGELISARRPEDIFGQLSPGNVESQLERIKEIYIRLTRTVFPDHYRGNIEEFDMASKALEILNVFREKAIKRVNGEASDAEFIIKKSQREYHIDLAPIAEGDLSIVFGGYYSDSGNNKDVIVKIIKDPSDADLMRNEAKIIRILQAESGNQSKHLPILLDQFRTTDRKTGLILDYFDGYDLYSVREKYKDGIDQKDMVWMLNRSLSLLGRVHINSTVHGNVDPSHFMIRPRDHNMRMIDWSYGIVNSSVTGDGFKVFNKDFSPPEVKERKMPIPASDLYSIGKCMIYVLGGDIKTNIMPDSVDKELQRFIQFFVRESPIQRAQDAWEMQSQLVKLIERLWGPRKFREFRM